MLSNSFNFSSPNAGQQAKISLAAYKFLARKCFRPQAEVNLKSVAEKCWEVAPGETSISPAAFFLPGQLERVTAWEARFFPYEHPARTMHGGLRMDHAPTRAHLIKDVWLIDGALYKRNASYWLSRKPSTFPRIVVDREIQRGATYCTHNGSTWFGTWLMEDCVTYALARNEGVPVTIAPTARYPLFTQAPAYEHWLDMRPVRLHAAFFRELVLFDDLSDNRSRHLRYRAMGDKLLSHVDYADHPGVFILRGGDGDLRLLRNEMAIAEHLHRTRGFRILDPLRTDVPTIVATCAGARVVAGVEGSQLVHGVNVLAPGRSLLVLQPPNRFVSYYKYLTDRDHQHFAFVVGTPQGDGFTIDIEEVERTLDLLPA